MNYISSDFLDIFTMFTFPSSWKNNSERVYFCFLIFFGSFHTQALSIMESEKFWFYDIFTRISNMVLIVTSFHSTSFSISFYLLINIFSSAEFSKIPIFPIGIHPLTPDTWQIESEPCSGYTLIYLW